MLLRPQGSVCTSTAPTSGWNRCLPQPPAAPASGKAAGWGCTAAANLESTVLSSDPFRVLSGDREPQQHPALLLKRCKALKRAARHRQRCISPLEVLHLSTRKSNLPNHKAFTAESKHGGAAGVTVLRGENTVFQH